MPSVQFIRASVGEAVARARGRASGGARANHRSACTPSSICTGCTRAHAGPCRTLSGTSYCQSVAAALDYPATRWLPTVSCASVEIIYFLNKDVLFIFLNFQHNTIFNVTYRWVWIWPGMRNGNAYRPRGMLHREQSLPVECKQILLLCISRGHTKRSQCMQIFNVIDFIVSLY